MIILNTIGNFLLSEWLWSMTFAWSYFVTSVMMHALLLWRFVPLAFFRSLFLSFLAISFAFVGHSLIVIGVFIHVFRSWYVPGDYELVAGPLRATIYLALIYTVFHAAFYGMVHRMSGQSWTRLMMIACASNGIAALLSYGYIALVFKDSL